MYIYISFFDYLSLYHDHHMMLMPTPTTCYCMTSFDYAVKKARSVCNTCRCHLSKHFL